MKSWTKNHLLWVKTLRFEGLPADTRAVIKESGFLEQSKRRSRGLTERRTLADSMWRASVPTHDASPRQLPTDHDHDGGPQARSANIRAINRRASPRPALSLVQDHRPEGGNDNSIGE
jgi:hypothetical protein